MSSTTAGAEDAGGILRHRRLARFLTPVVIMMVAQSLAPQFINGGLARAPHPTHTLAAFALAWGLVDFLQAPLSLVRQLALVLGTTCRAAAQRVLGFVILCALVLVNTLALLALSDTGRYIIQDLHGASPALADTVRIALLALVPIPLIEGLLRFASGLLMRIHRTDVVSAAMLAGIGASIAMVFVALPLPFVQAEPIWLPILVTYAAVLVDLIILAIACVRLALPALPEAVPAHREGEGDGEGAVPTWSYLIRFFWPLALIMAIQGFSRPVINLFVSRGDDSETALAALAVVYPLALIPYSWINEARSLPAAFREYGAAGLRQIRRFTGACGLLSFGIMVFMFCIPPVRDLLLLDALGLPSQVAERCVMPLILFSLLPLTVAPRSYLHGLALLEHRTRSLAPSAPTRIGAIVLVMVLLPGQMPGATRGAMALVAGFVMEAVVLWWFVLRVGSPRPTIGHDATH